MSRRQDNLKSLFYRIAIVRQSSMKSVHAYSQFLGPHRKSLGFSLVCNYTISSLIIMLNRWRSPAAISWGVRSIIVDAINAASFGNVAHICIEVFKFTPSLTNNYPPTTIVFIFTICWIIAACVHAFPFDVKWGSSHSVPTDAISNLFFQTAATPCTSASQTAGSRCLRCLPAIALAHPQKFLTPRWFLAFGQKMQNDKFPESQAGQVYKSFVRWFILVISHVASIPGDLVRAVSGCESAGGSFILAESHA